VSYSCFDNIDLPQIIRNTRTGILNHM